MTKVRVRVGAKIGVRVSEIDSQRDRVKVMRGIGWVRVRGSLRFSIRI
jgi:hypothetical protein